MGICRFFQPIENLHNDHHHPLTVDQHGHLQHPLFFWYKFSPFQKQFSKITIFSMEFEMCFSNVFSLAPEINDFFRCLRLWNFSTGGKATEWSTFLKTGPPKRTLYYYNRPILEYQVPYRAGAGTWYQQVQYTRY